jgi:hypothetical protein
MDCNSRGKPQSKGEFIMAKRVASKSNVFESENPAHHTPAGEIPDTSPQAEAVRHMTNAAVVYSNEVKGLRVLGFTSLALFAVGLGTLFFKRRMSESS